MLLWRSYHFFGWEEGDVNLEAQIILFIWDIIFGGRSLKVSDSYYCSIIIKTSLLFLSICKSQG